MDGASVVKLVDQTGMGQHSYFFLLYIIYLFIFKVFVGTCGFYSKVAEQEEWDRQGTCGTCSGDGIEPQTVTLRAVKSAFGGHTLPLCPYYILYNLYLSREDRLRIIFSLYLRPGDRDGLLRTEKEEELQKQIKLKQLKLTLTLKYQQYNIILK